MKSVCIEWLAAEGLFTYAPVRNMLCEYSGKAETTIRDWRKNARSRTKAEKSLL
jgi:hypothetical protein